MSVISFFIRFTLVYTLIMAVAGITLGLLEIKNASSFNTPVLFAVAYWIFYSYSKKNDRIIEGNEKWKLVFSALAGDVLASLLLGIPTMVANDVPIKFLFIGLILIIPLHFLFLLGVNYVVKKQMVKQQAASLS